MTSKSKGTFYLTTTLPYVNAEPHLGHAMEFIRADIIVRYKKLLGYETFFNTGTDEHGIKIFQKAQSMGKDAQVFVDEHAGKFRELLAKLGISDDINFIRTTDARHVKAAQEFWRVCDNAGYIYKKSYKVKYCIGCELEKTDSELVDGKCPLHPNQQIELIEEENYFFKFSAFQERLLKLYEERPDFVVPDFRFNEIKSFVSRGLEDFSISRLKSKMPWGIEVPGDAEHVMYVWFDALVNYIAAVGWPDNEAEFKKWWPVTQYCGKDNLRQQSAMWQAMLMAAGLEPSRQIIINGFVTGEGGIKMSKSLGNVVNPLDVVNEYGTDALRYYVARELHPFEDSPFTLEKFKESYNANLANGIGNLTSRVLKMMISNNVQAPKEELDVLVEVAWKEPDLHLEKFDIKSYCDGIWREIADADKYIQDNQPFKTIKTDKEKGERQMQELMIKMFKIVSKLEAIMPETARKINDLFCKMQMPEEPLFMRRD